MGRTRRTLAALVLATSPALAACASGKEAHVTHEFSVHDGEDAALGSLRIRDVRIPAPPSTSYTPGSSLSVAFVIVNVGHTTDTLTGASSPIGTASLAIGGGSGYNAAPGQVTAFTPSTSHVTIAGLRRPVSPGQFVRLTLQFSNAGSVTMNVPVSTRNDPGFPTPTSAASVSPAA